MKKTNTTKALLAGAAIAGLMGGSAARLQAASTTVSHDTIAKAGVMAAEAEMDASKGVHACKGMNACKGQGGCKTADHDCKGKNACKGQGGCATDGSHEPEEETHE